MAQCVQEEERQKMTQKESVNVATNIPKGNKKHTEPIKAKDKTTTNKDVKKRKMMILPPMRKR
jgi:hypothetical protein